MGEPERPRVNIVVTYEGTSETTGATTGNLTVCYATDSDTELGLLGDPVLTVPIVSGGRVFSPAPKNAYNNLKQELTSTSSSEILKDQNHGGSNNIIIRLPNTGGDAVHQGNNLFTQETSYTEGCVAVTAKKGSSVDVNYSAFKDAINPYGYTGENVNVTVK